MTRTLSFSILLCLIGLTLAGCLTVERKSYKITMTGPTSGSCTITYHNIVSTKDDGRDISFKEFAELITDYLEGTKPEDDMPGARNVRKRLYSEGKVLNAELTFEFDSLSTLKMYKYDNNSPYMMALNSMNSETYSESNGTHGGESMPVVFWPSNATTMTLENSVTAIDTSHVSLYPQYEQWKKTNKK
ncbi:MAG: hypothetical protein SGJ05_11595 [bacterium]|nr:hypothetical protein [bacterium]